MSLEKYSEVGGATSQTPEADGAGEDAPDMESAE